MAYRATLQMLPQRAVFDVQGKPERIRSWVQQAGGALPASANTVQSSGERHTLSVGPEQWLLIAPLAQEEQLLALTASIEQDPQISVVEVSDQYQGFELSGEHRSHVLAQATSLPLARLAPGQATFTETFGTRALLWVTCDDAWRLFVERSFTDFLLARFTQAIGHPPTSAGNATHSSPH